MDTLCRLYGLNTVTAFREKVAQRERRLTRGEARNLRLGKERTDNKQTLVSAAVNLENHPTLLLDSAKIRLNGIEEALAAYAPLPPSPRPGQNGTFPPEEPPTHSFTPQRRQHATPQYGSPQTPIRTPSLFRSPARPIRQTPPDPHPATPPRHLSQPLQPSPLRHDRHQQPNRDFGGGVDGDGDGDDGNPGDDEDEGDHENHPERWTSVEFGSRISELYSGLLNELWAKRGSGGKKNYTHGHYLREYEIEEIKQMGKAEFETEGKSIDLVLPGTITIVTSIS